MIDSSDTPAEVARVIARTFDDGDGARVADGEAFAGNAAEIAFALDRAIEHGIADNDRLLRHASRGRPSDRAAELASHLRDHI